LGSRATGVWTGGNYKVCAHAHRAWQVRAGRGNTIWRPWRPGI